LHNGGTPITIFGEGETVMGIMKRVYTDIDEAVFYGMIRRAQVESVYTSEDGKVDIGKLLRLLISTYADGTYLIMPEKNKVSRTKSATM
jgi:hypothetical protein